MASRGRSRSEEAEEEGRQKKSSRQEEGKVMEASDGQLAPPSAVTRDPVALLTNPQAAHPANAPRHAQAVRELQRQRGNTYVQQVVNRVQAEKGSGQPLDAETRAQMEEAFDQDFGEVRVHSDASASRLAEELGARAFTTGKDVFFREGAYRPDTEDGKKILRHELTHVVQQGRSVSSPPGDRTAMGLPSDVYEREAHRVSEGTASERPPRYVVGDRPEPEHSAIGSASVAIQKLDEDTVEVAPTEIESSAQGITERVEAREENINEQIQTWVEQGVGDLRDGIGDAVDLFNAWYAGRPRASSSAAFWSNVGNGLVAAMLGVLGVALGPAGVAVAVGLAIGSAIINAAGSQFKDSLTSAVDMAPDAAAADVRQRAIALGTRIDSGFDDFGQTLRQESEDLWWNIAIDLTQEPPAVAFARETLYTEAGVPRRNLPYAETMLSRMIFDYLAWEARVTLSEAFGRPESEVEIAEEQIRRRAAAAAQRSLESRGRQQ